MIFWIIVKAELKKSWRNNNKMYTKEQNAEIEKVCRVFADYIKENSYFDVVWSEKHYNPL